MANSFQDILLYVSMDQQTDNTNFALLPSANERKVHFNQCNKDTRFIKMLHTSINVG